MNPLPEVLTKGPLPTLSNRAIQECMNRGYITIDPFREEMLGPTAYRLRPHMVRYQRRDRDTIVSESVSSLDERRYVLQPKEHVVVSIEERIELSEGFVGEFFPASYCIEQQLQLTAGRLDAKYQHAVVFGVFNCSNNEVPIERGTQIARIAFQWLGENNIPHYGQESPGSYIQKVDELRVAEQKLLDDLDAVRRQMYVARQKE